MAHNKFTKKDIGNVISFKESAQYDHLDYAIKCPKCGCLHFVTMEEYQNVVINLKKDNL